jgi:hypothetical protein
LEPLKFFRPNQGQAETQRQWKLSPFYRGKKLDLQQQQKQKTI